MAKKEIIELVDDLDGTSASETIVFGFGKDVYEIDLSDKNAAELRGALAPFIEAAPRKSRLIRQRVTGSVTRAVAGGNSRERSADIREWAKERGIKVNARGRIPREVVVRYDKARLEAKSAPVAPTLSEVADEPKKPAKPKGSPKSKGKPKAKGSTELKLVAAGE